MMEKRQCYDNWWFWFFIFLMFSVFCISIMIASISNTAIEKGEYKITVDIGDNYKNLVEDAKEINCPDCNCNCPGWAPYYYQPLNWSPYYLWNNSLWNDSFNNSWLPRNGEK